MRVVSLLVLFLCGLCVSAAPDLSVAVGPEAPMAAGIADDADYLALQQRANQALDMLVQARERRLVALQLAVN